VICSRWLEPEPHDLAACEALVRTLGLSPFVARLLCRRGLSSAAHAASFLEPKLRALSDPFLLPQMERAVDRILRALAQNEQIVLYGDYDVDGVTSLALLTRILRGLGGRAECFLPMRVEEGYGLSADGVARCLATHRPALLIAVDCGTCSVSEISELQQQRGVDVIVLDHHTLKQSVPPCVALVNPKLGEAHHYLCSVGIVFKVAHAILKRLPSAQRPDLREYLDLVALGTIADLVPISEENRILVKCGLARLGQSRWAGVRALLQVADIRAPINCRSVAFGLAPRLNAAGRLGTAQAALELLLTDDDDCAQRLAKSLDTQNRDRRTVEDAVLADAETQLAEWFDATKHAAIVVGGRGWHPGVVGIVASRLLKRHHRPTIVIGFADDGLGKGSGRSIAGLSLVETLGKCSALLEQFGGHEMAAGVTIRDAQFDEFRNVFMQCVRETIDPDLLQPSLQPDAELRLRDVNYQLLLQHERLEPFGMGNPQPLFVARRVQLAAAPRILKEKHRSLILAQDEREHRAVWFGSANVDLPPPPWDVAFQIGRNEYQDRISAQIEIKALRASV
jgi:single-stranded-DNA-specific exonuclease